MMRCPVDFSSFAGKKDDKDGKDEKSKSCSKKSNRKFPWVAVGGLTLVTLVALATLWFTLSLIFRYSSAFFFILSLPFKGLGSILSVLVFWPIKFLFSLIPLGASSRYSPDLGNSLHCNNTMEFQGWEVLNLVPGLDGNPQSIKYQLNSPTPHAISIVDIDYRDTRLDVLSNGKYYGSTSDFALDKSVFCGEDLNACIQSGFSMGTVVIPGGKQSVEISWSGKDVFPGTDKIVWGANRRRRVMWKKDLCL